MKGFFFLRLLLLGAGAMLVAASASIGAGAGADAPSVESVRERLRRQWEAVSYLRIQSEDLPTLDDGGVDRSKGHMEVSFLLGPEDKRAVDVDYLTAEAGKSGSLFNSREDGERIYGVVPIKGHPGTDTKLLINKQKNGRDRYEGGMTALLWLLMPDGKPPYMLLDGEPKVDGFEENGDLRLSIKGDGTRFHCVLSAEHDYQPSRIWFDGNMDIVVTKFERKAGLWFPVAAKYTNPGPNGTLVPMRFEVTTLEVNKPIEDSAFGRPEVPEGAIIYDATVADRD